MKESVSAVICGIKLSESNDALNEDAVRILRTSPCGILECAIQNFGPTLHRLSFDWIPENTIGLAEKVFEQCTSLNSLSIRLTTVQSDWAAFVPDLVRSVGEKLEELEYSVSHIANSNLTLVCNAISEKCTKLSKFVIRLPQHKSYETFLPVWSSIGSSIRTLILSAHYGTLGANVWTSTFQAISDHCNAIEIIDGTLGNRVSDEYVGYLTNAGSRLLGANLGAMTSEYCAEVASFCHNARFSLETNYVNLASISLLGTQLRELSLNLINVESMDDLGPALDACQLLEKVDLKMWGREELNLHALFGQAKPSLKHLRIQAQHLELTESLMMLVASRSGALRTLDLHVRELRDRNGLKRIGIRNPNLSEVIVREEGNRAYIDPKGVVVGILRAVQACAAISAIRIFLRLAPWISRAEEREIEALQGLLLFRDVDVEICRIEAHSTRPKFD